MKRRYDRNADVHGFQPGDAVWLYNPRVKKTLSPKLSRPWEGPYRVMERLTDVVYRIQRSPRSKARVVNRFRLWRVAGELPGDWWESGSTPTKDLPVDEVSGQVDGAEANDTHDDAGDESDDNVDNDNFPCVTDRDRPRFTKSGRTVKLPLRFRT
jgi:hypothetical protein